MWGRNLPIVGVVRDFHTDSLRDRIEPTVLINDSGGNRTLSIKIHQAQLQNIISEVKTQWEVAYPEHIFDLQFSSLNKTAQALRRFRLALQTGPKKMGEIYYNKRRLFNVCCLAPVVTVMSFAIRANPYRNLGRRLSPFPQKKWVM